MASRTVGELVVWGVLPVVVLFLFTALVAPGFLVSDSSDSSSHDGATASTSSAGSSTTRRPGSSFVHTFVENVNNNNRATATKMICNKYPYGGNTVDDAIAMDASIVNKIESLSVGAESVFDVRFRTDDGKRHSSRLRITIGNGSEEDNSRYCVTEFFFAEAATGKPGVEETRKFANDIAGYIGNVAKESLASTLCPYSSPPFQPPGKYVVDKIAEYGYSSGSPPEISKIDDPLERSPRAHGTLRDVRLDTGLGSGHVIEISVAKSWTGELCVYEMNV